MEKRLSLKKLKLKVSEGLACWGGQQSEHQQRQVKCLSCWKGCLTTGRLKLASSEQGFKKFTLKFLQNLWNYPALPDFPCYLYKMKSKKKKEKTILHTTGTILFNDSSLCLCERGSIEEKQLQYWIVYNIIKAQGIEQVGGHYRTITLSTLLRTSCPSLIR